MVDAHAHCPRRGHHRKDEPRVMQRFDCRAPLFRLGFEHLEEEVDAEL